MTSKVFDPGAATDEELAAEAARLAKLRTEVREAQNAVQAEQETRTMLAGLSGAARESVIKRLDLGGSIASKGEAATAEEV